MGAPPVRPVLGTMTFGGQVDEAAARNMLRAFHRAGHRELDTAYIYCEGRTEEMLGRLIPPSQRASWQIATKAHPTRDEGLRPGSVSRQLDTSLARLGTDRVDLFYLHSPDLDNPIEDTLDACRELHREGKFGAFGLSNYAAWQVAEIVHLCRERGWIVPTVYQGMYNPLTRDVERELFPCLRNYGIRFYAYNPLAGGMLTGKHTKPGADFGGGRFDLNESYRPRYWLQKYFDAVSLLVGACRRHGITPAAAALRWLVHHSMLSGEAGDALILGASRPSHLEANLAACADGPLPDEVVSAFDEGWAMTRPACIKYFRP